MLVTLGQRHNRGVFVVGEHNSPGYPSEWHAGHRILVHAAAVEASAASYRYDSVAAPEGTDPTGIRRQARRSPSASYRRNRSESMAAGMIPSPTGKRTHGGHSLAVVENTPRAVGLISLASPGRPIEVPLSQVVFPRQMSPLTPSSVQVWLLRPLPSKGGFVQYRLAT